MVYVYFVHKAGDKTMTSAYDVKTTFFELAVEAILLLSLFYQHPPLKGVLKYMAEAIISRRGYGVDGKPELRTETISTNMTWTVPSSIRGNISVLLAGGGGGGTAVGSSGGGGGGYGHGATGGTGSQYGGGGGGYYTAASGMGGAGYSIYGTGMVNRNGNSGVCIIQYYA